MGKKFRVIVVDYINLMRPIKEQGGLYEKIKVTNCAIEFNREFLNYIGGQSNVACSVHKMPLISGAKINFPPWLVWKRG